MSDQVIGSDMCSRKLQRTAKSLETRPETKRWPRFELAMAMTDERLHDDHVVMVRVELTGGAVWTLPCGGIEPGESPGAAALRELRE